MRNQLDNFEEAGLTFSNVVSANVYLDNVDDFAKMNAVYTQYFAAGVKPARTTVQQLGPGTRDPDTNGSYPTLEQVSFVAVTIMGRAFGVGPCRPDPEGPTPIFAPEDGALLDLGEREHQSSVLALALELHRFPQERERTAPYCRPHRHADANAALRRLHGILPAHEAGEIREEDVERPADSRDVGRHCRRGVNAHVAAPEATFDDVGLLSMVSQGPPASRPA